MNRLFGPTTAGALAFGLLYSASPVALAQTTTASGLDEIVVTATRRETSVQDTPIAVTAIGGEELRQNGISDPYQLSSLAPGLVVSQGGGDGQVQVMIRGQTNTAFGADALSPAATYFDDVYQSNQWGVAAQVFDMNRIEVLRGPQGTLFGKNTTAGSLNYYSQTPTDAREGYLTVDAGGGQYNHSSIEGAFNAPVTDNLAFRGSMRFDQRDPYALNISTGERSGERETYNLRAQLRYTGEDTTVNFKLAGVDHSGDGANSVARGYLFPVCSDFVLSVYFGCDALGNPPALPSNPTEFSADVDTEENYENWGGTLHVEHQFGDWTLASISNYQRGTYFTSFNDDALASDFFHSRQYSLAEQYSQEFRLATPEDQPLRAIFGLYGQYAELLADESSLSSLLDPVNEAFEYGAPIGTKTSETTTYAAFTSVTYDINPQFSVTGGLRYSYEAKDVEADYLYINYVPGRDITDAYFDFDYALSQFDPTADTRTILDDSDSWSQVTGDLKLSYTPNEDLLFYASVATGFRSGGIFRAPLTSGQTFHSLPPETVVSYELGVKSEWWDNRLRINGDVYVLDYEDMQLQYANPSGPGLYFDAGAAEIRGVELEVQVALIDNLLLSAAVAYTNAEFTDYTTGPGCCNGNSLTKAPDWVGNIGASYQLPVGADHQINFSTDWQYRGTTYFDTANTPFLTDDPHVRGDVRVGFGAEDGSWELAGYVNNVTDEDDVMAFTLELVAIAPTTYEPGRVWGAQLLMRY